MADRDAGRRPAEPATLAIVKHVYPHRPLYPDSLALFSLCHFVKGSYPFRKEHGRYEQSNQTTTFRRANPPSLPADLHPELFRILASEQVSRRAYEADIWLVEGGHVISLTAGKNTLTEVIVTKNDPMTDRGLLLSTPCRGEKYHEDTYGNIRYMISTQEEQLTQTLYDATKHEISSYAAKRELMTAEIPGDGRRGGHAQRAGHRTPQP